MNFKTRVLAAFGWAAGAKLAGQLLNWAITLVVIRLLEPADYGLMAIAIMVVYFCNLVGELGMGAALIQKDEIDKRTTRQIFGLVLLFTSLLFALLFAASPLIAIFFQDVRLVSIIRVLSAQFLIGAFAVIPRSFMQRELDFKRKSIVDLSSTIVGSLCTLSLALSGFGVWALVWGYIALNIVLTIGLNIIHPYIKRPLFSFAGMERIFHFGGFITLERALWYFYSNADVFIIGKLLGKNLLGHYSVAMNLASLPMQKIMGTVNQVAFPSYSTIYRNNKEDVGKYLLKSVRVMSFLSFPVLFGMSSVAPEIVGTFLGEKWQAATVPMQILCVVTPIRFVSSLTLPVIDGVGRPAVNTVNQVIALLLMSASFVIGSYWGLIGVSVSWLIAYPVLVIIMLLRSLPVIGLGLGDILQAIRKPALCGVVMYLGVLFVRLLFRSELVSPVLFVTLVLTGVCVYAVLALLINREGYREIIGLVTKPT